MVCGFGGGLHHRFLGWVSLDTPLQLLQDIEHHPQQVTISLAPIIFAYIPDKR
jgi:hypothetical protein